METRFMFSVWSGNIITENRMPSYFYQSNYRSIFGKTILKIVGGEVTVIVPPCVSIIDFTLTSPNPVPCILVVNRGSNILFMISLEISGPESCTSIIIDAVISLILISIVPTF